MNEYFNRFFVKSLQLAGTIEVCFICPPLPFIVAFIVRCLACILFILNEIENFI